jgi:hypothetical protein
LQFRGRFEDLVDLLGIDLAQEQFADEASQIVSNGFTAFEEALDGLREDFGAPMPTRGVCDEDRRRSCLAPTLS